MSQWFFHTPADNQRHGRMPQAGGQARDNDPVPGGLGRILDGDNSF